MRAKAIRWGQSRTWGKEEKRAKMLRGWGDVEKTKQLQGRGREDGFSLIRRTREKAQSSTYTRAHTHPLLHTLTPQKKKIHHTDFFMVWQSSDKIIR